jgi:hypothetical protein
MFNAKGFVYFLNGFVILPLPVPSFFFAHTSHRSTTAHLKDEDGGGVDEDEQLFSSFL